MDTPPPRLLDQLRAVLRRKHYSPRTEEAYVGWTKRFVLFHSKRHPKELGLSEVEALLTHLAVEQHVAASTQNQALSALLFLYTEALKQPLDAPIQSVRAKQPERLPTVLWSHASSLSLAYASRDGRKRHQAPRQHYGGEASC